jgi:IS5 family transposase
MKEVDGLLEDAALLEEVYQAHGTRRRHSRTRGRMQTPAEVTVRLLILKHVRNWSYDELEREVRANLVYRCIEPSRVSETRRYRMRKHWERLGQVIGPEVIRDLHERLVALAREQGVVSGRKLRVDTTVDVATLC